MKPQPEASNPEHETTRPDSSPAPEEAKKKEHRGHGKIAQLPKPLRDQINAMLDDGFSYPRIIQKLKHAQPPLPYPISEMNLSRWHDRGYKRHLAQQERQAEVRLNREAALDLLAGDDTITSPKPPCRSLPANTTTFWAISRRRLSSKSWPKTPSDIPASSMSSPASSARF